MKFLKYMALTAAACLSTGAIAQTDPGQDARYQELQSKLPSLLKEHKTGSVSVTLFEKGKISWTLVSGEQAEGVPATKDTMYGLASLTKPVMAEVVLRLVSEGRLSLDEPIHTFWTDRNVSSDERSKRLTPRLLLQHQSGFSNWRSMSGGVLKFNFDPGEKVQYSGEGYDYMVRVLERMFGKRFEVLAREVLFDPIGIKDAALVRQPWFDDRRAWRVENDGSWLQWWAPVRPSAASSLSATTEDYAKFVLSVMRQDAVSKEATAERKKLTINQVSEYCGPGEDQVNVTPCPAFMGFGIGWFLYGFEDHTLFYHNGSNYGEKSYVLFSPELDMGMVVASNGQNFEVIYEVIRALYGNEGFLAFERN